MIVIKKKNNPRLTNNIGLFYNKSFKDSSSMKESR